MHSASRRYQFTVQCVSIWFLMPRLCVWFVLTGHSCIAAFSTLADIWLFIIWRNGSGQEFISWFIGGCIRVVYSRTAAVQTDHRYRGRSARKSDWNRSGSRRLCCRSNFWASLVSSAGRNSRLLMTWIRTLILISYFVHSFEIEACFEIRELTQVRADSLTVICKMEAETFIQGRKFSRVEFNSSRDQERSQVVQLEKNIRRSDLGRECWREIVYVKVSSDDFGLITITNSFHQLKFTDKFTNPFHFRSTQKIFRHQFLSSWRTHSSNASLATCQMFQRCQQYRTTQFSTSKKRPKYSTRTSKRIAGITNFVRATCISRPQPICSWNLRLETTSFCWARRNSYWTSQLAILENRPTKRTCFSRIHNPYSTKAEDSR